MPLEKFKKRVPERTSTPGGPKPPIDHQLVKTFWSSALFNETYLRKDLPNKYKDFWDNDEAGPFHDFYQQVLNLAHAQEDEDRNSWSETETINNWIKPVMALLGWQPDPHKIPLLEEKSFVWEDGPTKKTLRPDILYVEDQREKKYISSEKDPHKRLLEARALVSMVVEAKYWDRLEEERQERTESKKRLIGRKTDDAPSAPEEQTLSYIRLLKKDYGILTDGKTWRLYHKEYSEGSPRRSFEFRLGKLLQFIMVDPYDPQRTRYFIETLKYFYFFFSKANLFPSRDEQPLVDEILKYSQKYISQAEEDLRLRFMHAMKFTCNALSRSARQAKINIDLNGIRSLAETHLFNILFIRSCEAKEVLPVRAPDYRVHSLTELYDQIDSSGFDPNKDAQTNTKRLERAFASSFSYSNTGNDIFDKLINLTSLIQDHSSSRKSFGFTIVDFKESLFDSGEWKIAKTLKLNNEDMIQILFHLGLIESSVRGRSYQQIPYNAFSARQLGSIYESFLEYKIAKAEADLAFIKNVWRPANLSQLAKSNKFYPTARKGELFFTPNNQDRKDSGSYYTPDHIVQHIVRSTLRPVLHHKSSSEILNIRICDPAMGSGHFLGEALHQLTTAYLNRLKDEFPDKSPPTQPQARRTILDKCIFGADINPRAVKLAKLSLWLETAHIGKKLERLDDQLFIGNSLTDAIDWLTICPNGFDAVVMNPPYLGEKGNKQTFEPIKGSALGRFYHGKMDLFYFFIHLALDITRDKGMIGTITTNYYPTAYGAKTLRSDLKDRASFIEVINFNEMKIFDSAMGQHNMITVLSKGIGKQTLKSYFVKKNGLCTPDILKTILSEESQTVDVSEVDSTRIYDGENNYLRMRGTDSNTFSDTHSSSSLITSVLNKIAKGKTTVKSLFRVNNGVHTQADYLSKKKKDKYGYGAPVGSGIYILDLKEFSDKQIADRIKKSKGESSILRPFFKNSDISRYQTNTQNTKILIYLNKNIYDIKQVPETKKHLAKYAKLISDASDFAPYLHRAKTEDDFTGEKIVAPHRAKRNVFGYNTKPWFAASDVFFITSKRGSYSLKYLLGILNSNLIFFWLYHRGKRKGDNLELINQPLSEIPIPTSPDKEKAIVSSVDKLINNPDDKRTQIAIDQTVMQLYGLSKKDIDCVNSFIKSKLP